MPAIISFTLFSIPALAQVQSHPLSQLFPIDVNLNVTGVNITNISYAFFGNNSVDTYLYRSAASVLTLNSHLVASGGWVNSTNLNATNIYISDDTQLLRGAANRLDLASGDSFNLVSGALLIGGTTVIDSSRNVIAGTWVNSTNANLTSLYFSDDVQLSRGASNRLTLASGDSFAITDLTTGSVIFAGASGVLSQDNANLFWDDTNNRLGIGTASPASLLHVSGSNSNAMLNISNGTNSVLFVNGTLERVGIGTTTPQNTFNVIGDINATGTIYGSSLAAGRNITGYGTAGYIPQWFNTTSLNNSNIFQLGSSVGIGTTSPSSLLHVSGTGSTLNISNSTASHLYVSGTTGRVGIGTAAPEEKLHVEGSGTTNLRITSTNAVSGYYSANSGGYMELSSDTGGIRFANSLGGTAAMAISTTGNIGIGTTTPLANLDVFGNVSLNNTVYINNSRVGIGTTSPQNPLNVIGDFNATGSVFARGTNITGNTGWSDDGTVIRLTTVGDIIGIGTTSPLTQLHVVINDTNIGAVSYPITLDHQISNATNGSANVGTGILLRSEDALGNIENISQIEGIFTTATNGSEASALLFYTRTGGGSLTERLRIDGAGQAGINDTTPSGTLDIDTTVADTFVVTTGGNIGVRVAAPTSTLDLSGNLSVSGSTNSSIDGSTFFVDATNNRVGIGTTSPNVRLSQKLDIATSADYGGMSLSTWSTTGAHSPILDFKRSASATIGTHTLVANGDILGSLIFRGSDGTGFIDSAQIRGEVDGAPSNPNDMPGRLVFLTTPDGSTDSTERMRITSAGNVGIGTTSPQSLLHVSGTGSTLNISNSTASQLYVSGTTGNVGIGTTSPDQTLHVHKATAGVVTANVNSPLVVENNDDTHINILSPSTSRQGILFGDPDNAVIGQIIYGHSDNHMEFITNTAERVRITSAGNVGINTTTPQAVLNVISDGSNVGANVTNLGTGNSFVVMDAAADTTPFLIDNAGNVLIGTTTARGELTFGASIGDIAMDTADGSDSKQLSLQGGGSESDARGGVIQIAGNENTLAGSTRIYAGNVAGGNITLHTGGSERVRIVNDGSVGIGTTSPTAKLHTLSASGGHAVRFRDDTADGDVNVSIESGRIWQLIAVRTAANGGVPGSGFIIRDNGAPADRLVIDTSGNVGIGTTSPDARLAVNGNATIQGGNLTVGTNVLLQSSLAGSTARVGVTAANQFDIITDNTQRITVTGAGNVGIGTSSPGSAILNITSSSSATDVQTALDIVNGTTGAHLLFVNDTTGNVGIGTASPTSRLDVRTTATGIPQVVMVQNLQLAAADVGIELGFQGDTNNKGMGGIRMAWATSTPDDGTYYAFVNRNTAGALAERMRITQAGNVGIGTTSPGQELHVVDNTAGFISAIFESTSTQNANRIFIKSAGSGNTRNWGFTINTPTAGDFNIESSTSAGADPSVQRMTINVNGSVGINTTTPNALLNVMTHTTDSKVAANISNYGTGNSFVVEDSAADTTPFLIDNAGNVGIGTTGPAYPLQIARTAAGVTELVSLRNLQALAAGVGSRMVFTAPGTDMAYVTAAMEDATAAAYLAFSTSAVAGINERMRITSAGNVGIGTTSPGDKLFVNRTDGTQGGIFVSNTGGAALRLDDTTANADWQLNSGAQGAWFNIRNMDRAANDFVILNSNGNVGINTTAPGVLLHVNAGTDTDVLRLQDTTGTCNHNPGSGSEAVACTSDIRLKSNVRDAPSALDEIMKINVRQFEVKANNETKVGVIAQELLTVLPEYVSMGDDGYYQVQEPNPWKLLKAVQELSEENQELKSENSQLKSQLTSLESRISALESKLN